MISIYYVMGIIICHYIFDFIMQSEKWATTKSKSLRSLLSHTYVYSILWYLPILIIDSFEHVSMTMYFFPLVNFMLHTIIDYKTSKITNKQFAAKYYGSKIPNLGAFSTIGFDQVLHYASLFLTYIWLR